MKAASRKGFTLIEILIVVIILGILAAIVIPQFSSASEDAKRGAAKTTEASLRAQIQLWKLQHNDTYPTVANFNSDKADGSQWDIMTKKTTVAGAVDAAGTCGAYLQAVPVNQINGLYSVADANVAVGVEPTTDALNVNTSGWLYDPATGRIWATTKK